MSKTLCNILGQTSINSKPKQVTLNYIFSHNHNWEVYKHRHRGELREVEIREVEKMLSCEERGCCIYVCPNCSEVKVIPFGCNSWVCTHCGKKFTDKWANNVARRTFNVKHRHVVLTIPEELRIFFYEDRSLLKVLVDCAINTLADVVGWKLNHKAIFGVIAVLHTYGKDMKFNPHLHYLVTEGGFKKNGVGWM